jgi:cytochrome b
MTYKTRVWDLPTRIFHWSLPLMIVGLVTTAGLGGDAMAWHFRFGYTVLTLLLFRIVWGLVGGRWSRFSSFIYAPATVLSYAKGLGKPEHSVGHNPLGAGSVFAMLFFLLAQVAAGLFSDDEISNSGPLAKFVSNATVSSATWYHKNVGKVFVFFLIVLHIGVVIYYLRKKKENLIRPMLTGDKDLPQAAISARDDTRSRLLAAIVFGLCAFAVNRLVTFGG